MMRRRNRLKPGSVNSETEELKCYRPSPLDSIRDAVLTVSPKRQYLGILRPTIPAHTGPTENNVNDGWMVDII